MTTKKEEKLLLEHDKKGHKIFGKRRWENANIGWFSNGYSIESKVYGNPTEILTSTIEGNEINHELRTYAPLIKPKYLKKRGK